MSRGALLPRAVLAAALLVLAAGPAAACRLALALALDVSSSVDAAEYSLQSEGLAGALEDPEIVEAMLGGNGPVWIAVYEWSGRRQQALVADWRPMTSEADLRALAAEVRGFARSQLEFPTALGHAVGYAARLLRDGPTCDRQVLDVSGDGANNDGYEPVHAYGAWDFSAITVNALVVGGVDRPALVRYFENMVIRGPEAFVEVAEDYEDYGRAMRRKLLREVRPPMVIGTAR